MKTIKPSHIILIKHLFSLKTHIKPFAKPQVYICKYLKVLSLNFMIMKTTRKILVALSVISSVFFYACDKNIDTNSTFDIKVLDVENEGYSTVNIANYEETLLVKTDSLTPADYDGLLWMLEEEKMAHDLYYNFAGNYDLFIFDRITTSEQTHFNAIKRLLDCYEADYSKPKVLTNK